MKNMCSAKYYLMKDDSLGPQCDNYLMMIEKEERGEKFYSFVLFGLLINGEIKVRDTIEDSPTQRACELIEVIKSEFKEIKEEDFKRAEAEYLRRLEESVKSWESSSLFKKYYGLDIVTNEQKDIMDRVSKLLKKTKET